MNTQHDDQSISELCTLNDRVADAIEAAGLKGAVSDLSSSRSVRVEDGELENVMYYVSAFLRPSFFHCSCVAFTPDAALEGFMEDVKSGIAKQGGVA